MRWQEVISEKIRYPKQTSSIGNRMTTLGAPEERVSFSIAHLYGHQWICPYKGVFRPPLFIEDFYAGRISLPF